MISNLDPTQQSIQRPPGQRPPGLTPTQEVFLLARAAQAKWAQTPVSSRLSLVKKLRLLIAQNAGSLAHASASMRARPTSEALAAEVIPLAEACRYLEKSARKLLAPQSLGSKGLPLWLMHVRAQIHHQPLGVILIIGPGNYPLLLAGIQALQALVAGNAVVLKPGTGGTPCALALASLVTQAGFPPNLLTVIPESVQAGQEAIAALPDKVIFTGSSDTGSKILAALAPHAIPSIMELSGEDPVIVRHDANLQLTAKAIAFGLTINDGATCLAPRRLLAHESIHDPLLEALIAQLQSRDPIHLSPQASARLHQAIQPLIAQGAQLLFGTLNPDSASQGPFILACQPSQSTAAFAQAFAPLLLAFQVTSDDHAVALANASPYHLGASIFSADTAKAQAIAQSLQSGSVTINDLIVPTADARVPFGGLGKAGFGSTRGPQGLLDLTCPKVVTVTKGAFRPAYDKPHPQDNQLLETYLTFSHASSGLARLKALATLFKLLINRKSL
jgi:acyl-CoA reductase-like NAD-dependent aldehyde dehydrogenase